METSDIITTVVTVTLAIAYIVSLVVEGRRSKTILEKQLLAFTEISERMSSISKIVLEIRPKEESFQSFVKRVETALDAFDQSHERNRIYLPHNVDEALNTYSSTVFEITLDQAVPEDTLLEDKYVFNILSADEEAISLLRKYMGIKH